VSVLYEEDIYFLDAEIIQQICKVRVWQKFSSD